MRHRDAPPPTYHLIDDADGRFIAAHDGAPPYVVGEVFSTGSCFVESERAEVVSITQKKRGRPYQVRVRFFAEKEKRSR